MVVKCINNAFHLIIMGFSQKKTLDVEYASMETEFKQCQHILDPQCPRSVNCFSGPGEDHNAWNYTRGMSKCDINTMSQ